MTTLLLIVIFIVGFILGHVTGIDWATKKMKDEDNDT